MPSGAECGLEIGRVYEVSGVHLASKGDLLRLEDGVIVELSEDAIFIRVGTELWYPAAAFRPVQQRKTDISIFTAMLTGAKEREPA
jgi:hypothetical protein